MNVYSEALPLGDLLFRSANENPDRTALALPDQSLTYSELLQQAVDTARGLSALGIGRGDHVGILMPNSVEFVEAYFGATMLGAVIVPLNARFKAAELGYVIHHADLAAVLISDRTSSRSDFRAILAEALPSLPLSADGATFSGNEAPRLRQIISLHGDDGPGIIGRERFLDLSKTRDAAVVERARSSVRVRDTAMILYTSGTTAHPKGCMISHEAISRGSVGRLRENIPLGDRNSFWCVGPLFHIAAMQSLLGSIAVGGTFVTDTWFDPKRSVKLIDEYQVTSLWPWFQAVMTGLLNEPDFKPEHLKRITSVILIGAESHLHKVQELFPQALLINGCGMSELAGYYAMSPKDDTVEHRATSGGKPVSGIEVRIVSAETGLDAAPNELGEILIRGYLLMEGYYKDPEKTASAVDSEGWLHTGDLYRQDEEGHLSFGGRLKDMLKVGGENVPAIEVENFLCTHPDVSLAEVVARPDSKLEEVPVAFVELKPGADASAEEIIEYCASRIASFKVPRAVYFLQSGEWPMSATKVNKNALRAQAEQYAGAEYEPA